MTRSTFEELRDATRLLEVPATSFYKEPADNRIMGPVNAGKKAARIAVL